MLDLRNASIINVVFSTVEMLFHFLNPPHKSSPPPRTFCMSFVKISYHPDSYPDQRSWSHRLLHSLLLVLFQSISYCSHHFTGLFWPIWSYFSTPSASAKTRCYDIFLVSYMMDTCRDGSCRKKLHARFHNVQILSKKNA